MYKNIFLYYHVQFEWSGILNSTFNRDRRRARMFPVSTLTPDYSQLDSGIRVLVRTINGFGLPTYYSCEGHGLVSDRSPIPVRRCHSEARSGGRLALASFYGYARNIQFLAYGARRNSVGGHSHRESVNRLQSQADWYFLSVGGYAKWRSIISQQSWYDAEVVRSEVRPRRSRRLLFRVFCFFILKSGPFHSSYSPPITNPNTYGLFWR